MILPVVFKGKCWIAIIVKGISNMFGYMFEKAMLNKY